MVLSAGGTVVVSGGTTVVLLSSIIKDFTLVTKGKIKRKNN